VTKRPDKPQDPRFTFMMRAMAPDVPALAYKLAGLIVFKYMSRKTLTAYPSQETLAADLHADVRTVRRMLDVLRPLGLEIETGRGRHNSSVYRIGNPDASVRKSGQKTGHESPQFRPKNRTSRQRKPDISRTKTGLQTPTNYEIEPLEGNHERDARTRATLPPDPRVFENGTGQAASEPDQPPINGEVIPPKGNGAARPSRRAAGGTRIDPRWEPSDDDWSFAAARGLDANAIDFEVNRFRNWYLAKVGAAGLSADWSATWRNFVLGWDGRRSKQKQAESRDDHWASIMAQAIEKDIAKGDVTLQAMSDDNWGHMLHHFQRTGEWSDEHFGPRPGQPGCAAPERWLERYGFMRGPPP
jgi:hypothetical protein